MSDNEQPYVTPLTTKTGKVLSDSDVDALAEEAERGYDVPAPPDLCRWEINQKFRVTRGSFDREAESALYALGVRSEMNAPAFGWSCSVEATIDRFALRQARGKLYDLLRPYDVNVFIYDVRIVCMGVPK